MAVNWNNPTLTTLYTTFLTEMKDRDLENLLMNSPGDANLPIGAIRWAPGGINTLQYWTGVGTGWANLILSAAGGGTGTGSGVPAFGTMASQNANAVAITGGTITGVNFNANVITSGVLPLARGGTGASLALGAAGTFLLSNGSQVVFGTDATQLQSLNAAALAFNQIPIARMPTGGVWNLSAFLEIISAGSVRVASSTGFAVGNIAPMGNGTVNALAYYIDGVPFIPGSGVPTGGMMIFSGGCPAGWTNMNIDGRTIRFTSTGAGGTGGAEEHNHLVQGDSDLSDRPNTENTAMAGVNRSFDSGASFSGFLPNDNFNHHHDISLHKHFINFLTGLSSSWPKYIEFVLCRKD